MLRDNTAKRLKHIEQTKLFELQQVAQNLIWMWAWFMWMVTRYSNLSVNTAFIAQKPQKSVRLDIFYVNYITLIWKFQKVESSSEKLVCVSWSVCCCRQYFYFMRAIKSCNSKPFCVFKCLNERKKERKFVSSNTVVQGLTVACQCSIIELTSVWRLADCTNTLQCVWDVNQLPKERVYVINILQLH
jgi:hypothetical protein